MGAHNLDYVKDSIELAKSKGYEALRIVVHGEISNITNYLQENWYEFTISNPFFTNEYQLEITWNDTD